MKATKAKSAEQWAADWIRSVADGSNTMSSRRVSSIERRGGGLKTVAAEARRRKVHLVLLEDDQGIRQVAASRKPFKVLA
jgi:hypothetical protein